MAAKAYQEKKDDEALILDLVRLGLAGDAASVRQLSRRLLAAKKTARSDGFRDRLGQSSGIQSWQYRLIEHMLGNRDPDALRSFARDPRAMRLLDAERAAPSLYDEALRLAARHGLPVPPAVLARDPGETASEARLVL